MCWLAVQHTLRWATESFHINCSTPTILTPFTENMRAK